MKAIEVIYTCSTAMFNYLKNGNENLLISELKRAEQFMTDTYGGKNKCLWFKFGLDDTLATTITDIIIALKSPVNSRNRKLLIDGFQLVTKDLEIKNELQAFYS